MRVNIGDVVLIKYRTFTDELVVGIFAVIYHETYDVVTSTNFTAIKLSTEDGCYQIKLEKKYLRFLDHDSYLNCNAQFKFREDQVLKLIGKLSPYYLNKVLQQTRNYQKKIEKQLVSSIGEDKLFREIV